MRTQTPASPWRNHFLYVLVRHYLGEFLFHLLFKTQESGFEQLPESGAVLVCSKHLSWMDIPAIGHAIRRPVHFAAKEEMFHPAWAGALMRGLGAVPVRRAGPTDKNDASFKLMQAMSRTGEVIVCFPEGTWVPGRVGKGKIGLIRRIVYDTGVNVAVLPVGLSYAQPPWPHRTRITIRAGALMHPAAGESVEAFTGRLMWKIADLSSLQYEA